MRTARTIIASLAAVVLTAALTGTAAARNTANVYVAPAAALTDTATSSVTANVYVPPAALTDTANPAVASPGPHRVHRDRPDTRPSSSAFDWGSAVIGAAVTVGLVLIVVAGFAAAHRARVRLAR